MDFAIIYHTPDVWYISYYIYIYKYIKRLRTIFSRNTLCHLTKLPVNLANEALKMVYPLLKVRPMSEASKKGQQKAHYCQGKAIFNYPFGLF